MTEWSHEDTRQQLRLFSWAFSIIVSSTRRTFSGFNMKSSATIWKSSAAHITKCILQLYHKAIWITCTNCSGYMCLSKLFESHVPTVLVTCASQRTSHLRRQHSCCMPRGSWDKISAWRSNFLWFAPTTPGRCHNSTSNKTKTTSFHKLLNILPVIWCSSSALVFWLGGAQFESWPEHWLSSLSSPQPSSVPLVKVYVDWAMNTSLQIISNSHATQSTRYSTVW